MNAAARALALVLSVSLTACSNFAIRPPETVTAQPDDEGGVDEGQGEDDENEAYWGALPAEFPRGDAPGELLEGNEALILVDAAEGQPRIAGLSPADRDCVDAPNEAGESGANGPPERVWRSYGQPAMAALELSSSPSLWAHPSAADCLNRAPLGSTVSEDDLSDRVTLDLELVTDYGFDDLPDELPLSYEYDVDPSADGLEVITFGELGVHVESAAGATLFEIYVADNDQVTRGADTYRERSHLDRREVRSGLVLGRDDAGTVHVFLTTSDAEWAGFGVVTTHAVHASWDPSQGLETHRWSGSRRAGSESGTHTEREETTFTAGGALTREVHELRDIAQPDCLEDDDAGCCDGTTASLQWEQRWLFESHAAQYTLSQDHGGGARCVGGAGQQP